MAASVVFLPGVMGSRLYFPDPIDEYWDLDFPVSRMLPWRYNSDEWVRQAFRYTQKAHVVVTPDKDNNIQKKHQKRGWGTVSFKYHGTMLKALEKKFPDRVYAVGYDWRQEIYPTLAAYVAGKCRKIQTISGEKELILVGYSMGSLVIRSMLLDAAYKDVTDNITRLVYVFPPCVGAPVGYRRMFTGMTPEYDGDGFYDELLEAILGSTREAFVGNMSSVPGPMQLLPSDWYQYAVQIDGYWHPQRREYTTKELYKHADSPPGLYDAGLDIPPDALVALRDRIQKVVNFHDYLGKPTDTPKRDLSYLVYGDEVVTDVAVERVTNTFRPVKRPVSGTPINGSGDGTVPATSALSLGIDPLRVKRFTGVEHSEACNTEDVCMEVARMASL